MTKIKKEIKNKITTTTTTTTTEEDIINDIIKTIDGAEIIDANVETKFISTGNFATDFICSGKFWNGGLAEGRITEIYGPSSTGKTVLGIHFLQGVQKEGGIAVMCDSEHAWNARFGETLGIDTKKLIYMDPDSLEECFNKIIKVCNAVRNTANDDRPLGILYDSIAASPSRKEVQEIAENDDDTMAPKAEMGNRAKICSQYTRNIASTLKKQRAHLIIINQIRSKIGVMFGNPETTAGGGKALEYYCSIRLDCRKRKTILDKNKKPIGIEMDIKNTKNKISSPFRVAKNVELFFNEGISPTSGLLELLVEEGKLEKNGAWYNITGSDKKFQGQKKLPQILIENPEIIGAPSGEEVIKFINRNKQSLDISLSKDITTSDEDND